MSVLNFLPINLSKFIIFFWNYTKFFISSIYCEVPSYLFIFPIDGSYIWRLNSLIYERKMKKICRKYEGIIEEWGNIYSPIYGCWTWKNSALSSGVETVASSGFRGYPGEKIWNMSKSPARVEAPHTGTAHHQRICASRWHRVKGHRWTKKISFISAWKGGNRLL